MREKLYDRIAILEQNGVISAKAATYSRHVVDLILAENKDVPQDKLEMFITHFALAVRREEKREAVEPMDKALLESIRNETVFVKAKQLQECILTETGIKFSKAELEFLILHLCNLLS